MMLRFGVDHHDALVDVLQGHLELERFVARARLAGLQSILGGIEAPAVAHREDDCDHDQHGGAGRDREVGAPVVPVVRQDLVLGLAHIDHQRKILHHPVGDEALDAVLNSGGQERSSVGVGYPLEQLRAQHRPADHAVPESRGRPDHAVKAGEKDRAIMTNVDGVVEFRQIAWVERRDDHTLECAVGGANGAGQLQQPNSGGPPEQRLADEEVVGRYALLGLKIVPVTSVGAPGNLSGGRTDDLPLGIDDSDLEQKVALLGKIDRGIGQIEVSAHLIRASQQPQCPVCLHDGAHDVLLEHAREIAGVLRRRGQRPVELDRQMEAEAQPDGRHHGGPDIDGRLRPKPQLAQRIVESTHPRFP
jgi:hypothetical protein